VRAGVITALLLAAPSLWAAKLTIGPYVQDVGADRFVVAFETDVEANGVVEVGSARVSTHGTRHEAEVDALHADTRYKYRVFVDGVAAGGGEVATAPSSPRPFTFLVYGDTREGAADERRVAAAMLAENADFALHTGDLTRNGADEESWRHFFAEEKPLLASLPVFAAVGNHELYKDETGEHFRRYFVLPDEGRERRYYQFRWAGAQFIALDGNGRFDEQTRWLRETLSRAQAEGIQHVFVFLHQPPFSTGGHCGAAVLEKEWVELFERYRVRAVFGGHDHCYERLERRGIRYFVSGGGGAEVYDERDDCPSYDYVARKVYTAAHHYVRVRVTGDTADVTAVQVSAEGGPPLDAVRLGAHEALVEGEAPPLVDDRWFGNFPRRWTLYGAGFGLLMVAGGFLRRRRPR
jgi:hypothetical protein